MVRFLVSIILVITVSCASPRPSARAARGATSAKISGVSGGKNAKSKRVADKGQRDVTAVPNASSSLESVVKHYWNAIDQLGAKDASGGYLVADAQVYNLKVDLARALKIDKAQMKILTNPRSGNGWFGKTAIAIDTADGTAYFFDHKGQLFVENMKDRLFGGIYTDDNGTQALMTAFYGGAGEREFYHVYYETQKLDIITFRLDRDNNGSIEAKVRLPSGKLATISRRNRDNETIRINGSPLIALFK